VIATTTSIALDWASVFSSNKGWAARRAIGLLVLAVVACARPAHAQIVDPKVAPTLETGAHFGIVTGICPLSDGSWVSISEDGTLRKWSATGEPMGTSIRFDPSASMPTNDTRFLALTSLAVSSNGSVAAAEQGSGPVDWLLSGPDLRVAPKIQLAGAPGIGVPGFVAFTHGGKYLLASDGVGSVHLIDPLNPKTEIDQLALASALDAGQGAQAPRILGLAADRAKDQFACLIQTHLPSHDSSGVSIVFLSVDAGKLKALKSHELGAVVDKFELAPAGPGEFLIAGRDGEQHPVAATIAFGGATERPIPIQTLFTGSGDYPLSICADASGKHLVFGSALGQMFETDAVGKPTGRKLPSGAIGTSAIAYSADGKAIMFGQNDGSVYLWSGEGDTPVRCGKVAGNAPMQEITWAPSGLTVYWKRYGADAVYGFDLDKTDIVNTADAKPAWSFFNKSGDASLVLRHDEVDLQPSAGATPLTKAIGHSIATAVLIGSNRIAVAYGNTLGLLEGHNGQLEQVDTNWKVPSGVLALAPSPDLKFLAAACKDGFIRIFHAEPKDNDGLPIATVYVDPSGEWVCFDERTGTYASSVQGDQIFGYQISQGTDPAASFVSAKTLESKYRKDDWLGAAIAGNSPSTGQPAAKAMRDVPVVAIQAVEYANLEPGKTDVYDAEKGVTSIKVKVTTTSSQQVLFRIAHQYEPPGSGAKNFEVDKTISEKELVGRLDANTDQDIFAITAETADGVVSDPVVITVRRPSDQTTQGMLRILAVGIGTFGPKADLQTLAGPEYDATNFATVMGDSNRLCFGLKGVAPPVVLTNEGATKDKVMAALKELCNSNPADRVMFFISSHGDKVGGHSIVAPYDFDHSDPTHSGLDWAEMASILGAAKCRSKIVFVDTCHSGAGANQVETSLQTARTEASRLLDSNGVIVVASCLPEQNSFDDTAHHEGFFTEALLSAIKDPDIDWPTKDVFTDDLSTYVRVKVAKLTAGQTPKIYAPTGIEYPVIRALRPPKLGVH
jgi:WD40 repeat protein